MRSFILTLMLFLLLGCLTEKDSRRVKRQSKIIHNEKVISTYYRFWHPSSYHIYLRENNVFDRIDNLFLFRSAYYSGTYKIIDGKILFSYFKNHKPLNEFTEGFVTDTSLTIYYINNQDTIPNLFKLEIKQVQ